MAPRCKHVPRGGGLGLSGDDSGVTNSSPDDCGLFKKLVNLLRALDVFAFVKFLVVVLKGCCLLCTVLGAVLVLERLLAALPDGCCLLAAAGCAVRREGAGAAGNLAAVGCCLFVTFLVCCLAAIVLGRAEG